VASIVVEVRYTLQMGLEMQIITSKNKLPKTCNRMEATWQKGVRMSLHDHENIMEEAGGRDPRLKYDNEEESKDDELESKKDNDGLANNGE
jgi:hypothetical protein